MKEVSIFQEPLSYDHSEVVEFIEYIIFNHQNLLRLKNIYVEEETLSSILVCA